MKKIIVTRKKSIEKSRIDIDNLINESKSITSCCFVTFVNEENLIDLKKLYTLFLQRLYERRSI